MNLFNKLFALLFWTVSLLSIIFYNYPAEAQNNKFKFDHLTVNDGLSQSSVYCILQDSKGFMWFGTRSGGLNRYNGYSFNVFKHDEDNPNSISGNEIISLFEDSKGIIWAGTRNEGLNRFDVETEYFQQYFSDKNDSSSILDNTINCFSEGSDGTLWIGTNNGLCSYDRDKNNFMRYRGKKILNASDVRTFAWSHDGLLWVGGRNGLFLFDTKARKQVAEYKHDDNNPSSMSDDFVRAVVVDRKGRLWIGTDSKGLNRMVDAEKGIFNRYTNNPDNDSSISSNITRTLHEDRQGVLWIGTKEALDQLYPAQQEKASPVFVHIRNDENDDESLSQNSIYSFLEDSHGSFWIGNYNEGVNYLFRAGKKFKYLKHDIFNKNSLSKGVVSSFATGKEGVWIGTEGGGLDLFNRETGQFINFRAILTNPNSLASDFIKALYVDRDNDLWVGTDNGLQMYDKGKKKFISYIKGSYVYTIAEGVGDEIWIGTNKSLYKLNKSGKNIKYYEYINSARTSISSANVNTIYKDKKSGIWIGTKTGLNYYDRAKDCFIQYFHNKDDRNSISNSNITSICEDVDGNLWVGTVDGLNKYDAKSKCFMHYGEKDGLPNNVITNVVADDKGYFWVTTNSKLTKINPKASAQIDLYEKPSQPFVLRSYDIGDGLQCIEFRQNATFKSENGELYFGGVNGFNYFHPDSIINNANIPKVVITEFKLFNKPVVIGVNNSPLQKQISQTSELTLNYKQSVITFGFVALNYFSPLKNQFAYMMEGFDQEWNYIGNKREATYTNLPAGDYVFRVKASNNDGIWNEQGTSIKITVLPPWWQTWVFRIFIALLLIFTGLGFYYYRVNGLERQKRILEQKVYKRTVELEAANAELKANQERILHQQKELHQHKKLLEETNASKDKFFSILAHDLRNPFGSMLGFLELFKSDYDSYTEEERLQMVGIAIESAQLISKLIENLLSWSRSQRGLMPYQPEKINPKNIVDTEVSISKSMILKKGIELNLDYAEDILEIEADRNMLSLVIRNLVSNAIKFVKTGGKIGIKIHKTNNATLFEISDTGIGIPENVIDKLFRLDLNFNREGTANERGTGLGLVLCKEFIEYHKGKIWAKSVVGKGTTIYFTIPNV